MILAFLPWLDTSKVRSASYRPLFRQFFWIFVAVCIGLGWLGAKPAEGGYVIAARILTVYYFAHFLIILPLLGCSRRPSRCRTRSPNRCCKKACRSARPAPAPTGIEALESRSMTRTVLALALAGSLPASCRRAGARRRRRTTPQPPRQKWSFAGPFGKFDRAQLQRGFKVYREVCAACHGLKLRGVPQSRRAGGPGFSEAQAAAIAAEYKIKDGPNDAGEMFERAGRPADHFPSPFPNENAARAANGGALPPDLSVMAKARTYERGFPWFILDIVHAVPGAGRRTTSRRC